MTKKKVFIVGEHPQSFTGNGNMAGSLLNQIDIDKYDICFGYVNEFSPDSIEDPFAVSEIPFIPMFTRDGNDVWGKNKVTKMISEHDFDIVLFIGMDIWRYVEAFDVISKIKETKNFLWKVLCPFDMQYLREDWKRWFQYPDQVYIYSEDGYDRLSRELNNVKFFRPPHRFRDIFVPQDKYELKQQLLPEEKKDEFIFASVTTNQLRKNILPTLKGFKLALDRGLDATLFMLIENPTTGMFNLEQICKDYEIPDGKIMYSDNAKGLAPNQVAAVYNIADCTINFSAQEGLSWTVLESLMCGTPVALSKTTAHNDFINIKERINESLIFEAIPNETYLFPIMTEYGAKYLETRVPNAEEICDTLLYRVDCGDNNIQQRAVGMANEWHEKSGHIEDILEDYEVRKPTNDDQLGTIL